MIELIDIRKSYVLGPITTEILKGVSLRIEQGEIVSIRGTSGSGKSTLMNIMGMLDREAEGTYRFEGINVFEVPDNELSTIRNGKLGFVFQAYHLLPRLNAVQNVALPLVYRNVGARERHRRAMECLEKVGLGGFEHRKPSELSGGQQQRVAIARAIVGKPLALFCDEPTGALDTRVGQEIMDLFIGLNGEDRITVVIITHDPHVAAQCGRQVVMKDGLLVSWGYSTDPWRAACVPAM